MGVGQSLVALNERMAEVIHLQKQPQGSDLHLDLSPRRSFNKTWTCAFEWRVLILSPTGGIFLKRGIHELTQEATVQARTYQWERKA